MPHEFYLNKAVINKKWWKILFWIYSHIIVVLKKWVKDKNPDVWGWKRGEWGRWPPKENWFVPSRLLTSCVESGRVAPYTLEGVCRGSRFLVGGGIISWKGSKKIISDMEWLVAHPIHVLVLKNKNAERSRTKQVMRIKKPIGEEIKIGYLKWYGITYE